MSRRYWTPAEDALLRAMYPHCHTADVAAWLKKSIPAAYNRAFATGLRKSADYLASDAACRVQRGRQHPAMIASRIKPGTPAWNKGRKGVNGFSATRFQPGSRYGAAAQHYLPIGTTRINKDGVLERKVSDSGHRSADWPSVHSMVWVAAHGPIPSGHVVVFQPGKKTANEAAIRLADLECVSRVELMRRNSAYVKYPPEVARLIQLRGALNRQINKRNRAQEHA